MSAVLSELAQLSLDELNQLIDWVLVVRFFAITMVLFSLMSILSRLLLPQLKKFSKITQTSIDDAFTNILESLSWLFYLVLSLFISSQFFHFSPELRQDFYRFLLIFFTFYGARVISKLMSHGFKRFIDKKETAGEEVDGSLLMILKTVLQILTWMAAGILILENLGYKVSTLIGGLGIVSIIVALGVRNLLEDIISFISINLDKPFTIGDYIVIGQDSGTVEKIDLHSTRLKTPSGEQLIVANRELTNTRIKNYRRMKKRRDDFELKVSPNMPVEKLEKIPQIVESIFDDIEQTEFERCYFKEIDSKGFSFSVVYYILDRKYSQYIKVKQTVNLKIVRLFKKAGIELA